MFTKCDTVLEYYDFCVTPYGFWTDLLEMHYEALSLVLVCLTNRQGTPVF